MAKVPLGRVNDKVGAERCRYIINCPLSCLAELPSLRGSFLIYALMTIQGFVGATYLLESSYSV
ncbi:MAG: hypothetical protein NZ992_03995 [Candidatus Korarchaeum sp.]|nr:hypothetical protein [Candidatus Korarchaeum sp.]MDW8034935.1 hypothetical protein [Candidatus Korarchaeum sp.]